MFAPQPSASRNRKARKTTAARSSQRARASGRTGYAIARLAPKAPVNGSSLRRNSPRKSSSSATAFASTKIATQGAHGGAAQAQIPAAKEPGSPRDGEQRGHDEGAQPDGEAQFELAALDVDRAQAFAGDQHAYDDRHDDQERALQLVNGPARRQFRGGDAQRRQQPGGGIR